MSVINQVVIKRFAQMRFSRVGSDQAEYRLAWLPGLRGYWIWRGWVFGDDGAIEQKSLNLETAVDRYVEAVIT